MRIHITSSLILGARAAGAKVVVRAVVVAAQTIYFDPRYIVAVVPTLGCTAAADLHAVPFIRIRCRRTSEQRYGD
jgi:hypothetical protein